LRWPSWFAEAWKPPDHPIRLLVESKITAGSSLVHPEAVIRQLAFQVQRLGPKCRGDGLSGLLLPLVADCGRQSSSSADCNSWIHPILGFDWQFPGAERSAQCREEVMQRFLAKFLRDESGATAIEYGLIAAGIALAIIAIINGIGLKLADLLGSLNTMLK